MSDYLEFVKRMGSFDMEFNDDSKNQNENILQHHGVKGQKWGVRKNKVSSKTESFLTPTKKPKKANGAIKERINSIKREQTVKSIVKNRHELSDDHLKRAVSRVTAETSFKKNAHTKKQKKLYRNRMHLSDSQLNTVVSRLNMEANLLSQYKNIKSANRSKVTKVINKTAQLPLDVIPHGDKIKKGINISRRVMSATS